jgi:nucleoside 2-deoxyribosyltransferase
LSLPGWAEAERLQHQRVATGNRAFVAMSFDPSMDDAYIVGLQAGIGDANFIAFRMKEDIHTERIDAKIIAELRACRFVVADVTLNRPAVYYEAGFAQGLEKTVIWTCRGDWKKELCFDTRQFLHIIWTDPPNLREQLRPVIQALVY